jgi:hypothetical protein
MSNCVFGFPDFAQATPLFTPVVDNPVRFVSTLPGANVLDRRLTRVARSLDATTTNTQVLINLGVARPVGLLSVLLPNITRSATPTVQWVGYTDAAYTIPGYDSGAVQAFPTGVTAEDVTGPDGSPMNVWSLVIPSSTKTFRYWGCFVVDTANVDGYVDFARVIIAGAYRPSRPLSVGVRSQLENDTVRTKTEGGATLYKAMPTSRVDTFSLANIPESETLTSIRRMQHRLGTSGPLFFVLDETDPYRYMRSYQGTLRQLGALEYPDSLLYNTIGFEVAEDL